MSSTKRKWSAADQDERNPASKRQRIAAPPRCVVTVTLRGRKDFKRSAEEPWNKSRCNYYEAPPRSIAIGTFTKDERQRLSTNLSGKKLEYSRHTAQELVESTLADERCTTIKSELVLCDPPNISCITAQVMDFDISVADGQKRQLYNEIRNGATLKQLFQLFPDYEECWKEARSCAEYARIHHTVKVLLFASGFKGFRLLIFDPQLYLCVRDQQQARNCNIKALVKDKYLEYFQGMSLNYCDTSIYGHNLGIRTSLNKHHLTDIWPVLLFGDEEEKYGSLEQHSDTHQAILSFWTWLLEKVPTKASDLPAALSQPLPCAKRETRRHLDLSTSHLSKLVQQKLGFALQRSSVNQLVKEDNLLQQHDRSVWPVRKMTMMLDRNRSREKFICPNAEREHSSNNGILDLQFSHERQGWYYWLRCADPECRSANFQWPRNFFSCEDSETEREVTDGGDDVNEEEA